LEENTNCEIFRQGFYFTALSGRSFWIWHNSTERCPMLSYESISGYLSPSLKQNFFNVVLVGSQKCLCIGSGSMKKLEMFFLTLKG
jgi:hypothetical protein